MSQTDFVDPREDLSHPIEQGQVYEDGRTGDELVILYADDDTVLLRDEQGDDRSDAVHRIEGRRYFEKAAGSNRYSLLADESGETASGKIRRLKQLKGRYEDEDGRVASHKVEAFEEAIEMIENGGRRPDDTDTVEFEDVDGIGSKAADALRANGFHTKGDVRTAEVDEIKEVPYMGQQNTRNLIEYVDA